MFLGAFQFGSGRAAVSHWPCRALEGVRVQLVSNLEAGTWKIVIHTTVFPLQISKTAPIKETSRLTELFRSHRRS